MDPLLLDLDIGTSSVSNAQEPDDGQLSKKKRSRLGSEKEGGSHKKRKLNVER